MELQQKIEGLQNVYQVLDKAADAWGDKTALIFDQFNQRFSFNEVKEEAEEYATLFSDEGVVKGDKVALMLPNVPAFPFSWLGLGLIGAVTVPMNYRYQLFDAAYILKHSESKLVVTTAEKVDMLTKISKRENLTFRIITVDEKHTFAFGFLPDMMKALSDASDYQAETYAETLMNIQYTSGTTGKPKGCMLSQKYWINIGEKISDPQSIGVTSEDILLTSQPFYYMDPQWNTMSALVNGATLVILDRFSPSVFWEKIRKYKVTFFYCLGNMPLLLLKMPESDLDKSHHVRFVGCSAIPPQFQKVIEERWGVKWYEIFGMTETGYDISIRPEEHEHYIGTNALGRPSSDREVRIVDENDTFVERGITGEMVFRGKGMMDGYYKNPEATKEVFRYGWFHTGDLAYKDDYGVLYYKGRKKDMIRRSGENIAAAEVEEVILQDGNMKIAAVVPVEDEIRGEEIKAYIVTKEEVEDQEAYFKKVIAHCEKNLSNFKVPRYWEMRDSLPLTPSERVAKHLLTPDDSKFVFDRNSKNHGNGAEFIG